MATESLIPIAALTNLILGVIIIILANRDEHRMGHKRFTALLFGWFLIFSGTYYMALAMIEIILAEPVSLGWSTIVFGTYELTGDTAYDTFVLMAFGMRAGTYILLLAIALHYPYDLGSGDGWNSIIMGSIGVYCLVVPPLIIFSGFNPAAFQGILVIAGTVIWLHIYIRSLVHEVVDGDETARSTGKGAALLLVASNGYLMIWWLSTITLFNNEWFSGVLSLQPESSSIFFLTSVNLFWISGFMSVLVLTLGELYRSYKRSISMVSIVVFFITVMGFMNYFSDVVLYDILVSCYEAECAQYPVAYIVWNTLTEGILILLLQPLVLVYILIQYQLIDTSSTENRNLLRVMILLLLLIISSAFIELLQSMIPISQMLTAAFLAIGVAFFIGWEEKITAWFVTTDSDGDSSSIIGDESISTLFGKFTMMMSITLIYIIVFCCLFTSMGVGA